MSLDVHLMAPGEEIMYSDNITHNLDSRAKTARKNFTQPVVYKRALEWLKRSGPWNSVLDFGAGYSTFRDQIKDTGTFYWAYDLDPAKSDLQTWDKPWCDLVLVSNVLNVQETEEQLTDTIRTLLSACLPEGTVIVNYPRSPRRLPLSPAEMKQIVNNLATKDRINVIWA